jgi:hypothetical protein
MVNWHKKGDSFDGLLRHSARKIEKNCVNLLGIRRTRYVNSELGSLLVTLMIEGMYWALVTISGDSTGIWRGRVCKSIYTYSP